MLAYCYSAVSKEDFKALIGAVKSLNGRVTSIEEELHLGGGAKGSKPRSDEGRRGTAAATEQAADDRLDAEIVRRVPRKWTTKLCLQWR